MSAKMKLTDEQVETIRTNKGLMNKEIMSLLDQKFPGHGIQEGTMAYHATRARKVDQPEVDEVVDENELNDSDYLALLLADKDERIAFLEGLCFALTRTTPEEIKAKLDEALKFHPSLLA